MFYDLVVLDTGISGMLHNEKTILFKRAKDIWKQSDFLDTVGHGTAVTAVFKSLDISLAVFDIFDNKSTGYTDELIDALEFINNNIKCNFIQMSIGVLADNERLYNVCKQLASKGTIIVSAYSNNMAISYPAAYEFVIGVDVDRFAVKECSFRFGIGDIVDIFAKGNNCIIDGKKYYGTSFAASYVTKELLKSGRKFISKEDAVNYLKYISVNEKKKIAIFPFNKENKTLVNYAYLNNYELVDVYDVKHSVWFNRDVMDLKEENSFKVKNIEKCDWSKFEYFVIGHVNDLEEIYKKSIKKELLNACLKYGKNVISYDSILINEYRDKFKQAGLKLMNSDDIQIVNTYGKLYQLKTPVLAVIGTGKSQGKFSFQIYLKELLKSNGINAMHLGTEPNSILLGAEEMFSYGYSSVNAGLSNSMFLTVLNQKLKKLENDGADIIITGAQSALLPKFFYNTQHLNLNCIAFLYGTRPDGVILTIGLHEDVEYIKKTLRFIEDYIGAKVLFLVLFPFNVNHSSVLALKSNKSEDYIIDNYKSMINKEIGLNVVINSDWLYDKYVLESIKDFFTEED